MEALGDTQTGFAKQHPVENWDREQHPFVFSAMVSGMASFHRYYKGAERSTVAMLIDTESGNWDFSALQDMLGFSMALLVATDDNMRPVQSHAQDTLVFTY